MSGTNAEPKLYTIIRKRTRSVRVCDLVIGGGHPVVVQEMASTYTADVEKTCAQIASLKKAGCRLVRVAVPDHQSAEAIRHIKKCAGIPIIADVHFDYRLAVAAVENGCDKLRINPGNIGSRREDIVISLKSTDIALTVASNKLVSAKLDYPLHVGITESGVGVDGMIRSAAGLGTLLLNGIGDTVRVSLTSADRLENLAVCREVLQTLGIPYV